MRESEKEREREGRETVEAVQPGPGAALHRLRLLRVHPHGHLPPPPPYFDWPSTPLRGPSGSRPRLGLLKRVPLRGRPRAGTPSPAPGARLLHATQRPSPPAARGRAHRLHGGELGVPALVRYGRRRQVRQRPASTVPAGKRLSVAYRRRRSADGDMEGRSCMHGRGDANGGGDGWQCRLVRLGEACGCRRSWRWRPAPPLRGDGDQAPTSALPLSSG